MNHFQARTVWVPRIALALGSALASAGGALASPGEPSGPQYRLYVNATQQQALPAVAMSPSGQTITAYLELTASGGMAVRAQSQYARFALQAQPQPQPENFSVTEGGGAFGWPSVAMSKYGYALVAWQAETTTHEPLGIFAQPYFSSNPDYIGAPVRIDTPSVGTRYYPAAATDWYGGRYAVAWVQQESDGRYGVHIRRFDSALLPVGSEQRVDVNGMGVFQPIGLAMADTSRHVVVWDGSVVPGGAQNAIFVQRYDNDTALGTPQIVAQTGSGVIVVRPAVDMAGDGSFVVVWVQANSIQAQRFDADGNALGSAFQVSSAGSSQYRRGDPNVAIDRNGGFVIAWDAHDANGYRIMARRYAADGTPRGDELQVNETATGELTLPHAAIDADGDALIAWTDAGASGTDYKVFARRLQGDADIDLSVGIEPPYGMFDTADAVPFTLAVTNHAASTDMYHEGANHASGVAVQLSATPGATLRSFSGDHWQCDGNAAPIRCEYASLLYPGGSSAPLRVDFNAAGSGTLAVQAQVAGQQIDTVAANDSANASADVRDLTPDAFAFATRSGVARNSEQVSDSVVIGGIEGAVDVAVTGGEASINGAAFSASPGPVRNGDSLRLRHVAANTFATYRTTTVYVGRGSASFASLTEAQDTVPDAFAFADQTGVARNSAVVSNAITVAGINDAATISVSGGSYSINGAAFTSAAGTVTTGQNVRVMHTASAQFATRTDTTLSIGGVSDTFSSTTEAQDTMPDAFAFADQANVATGVAITSAPITVSGINSPAIISASGGAYSINGGAFFTTAGSVNAGDQVRMQHVSAATANTAVNTVLNIGGVNDTFTSTTGAIDTTPSAFAFTDVSGARRGRAVISNAITIGGINAPVTLSVSGGDAHWSKNGGTFTTAAGTVSAGDSVRVQVTASSTAFATVNVGVTIGGVSDTWNVTSGSK